MFLDHANRGQSADSGGGAGNRYRPAAENIPAARSAGRWLPRLCVAGWCRLVPSVRVSHGWLHAPVHGRGGIVALVNRNVEAGLRKLLFHVDLARLLQAQQLPPHPGQFLAAQPGLAQYRSSPPSGAGSQCPLRHPPRSHSSASAASGTPPSAPPSSPRSACETPLHAPAPGQPEIAPSTAGSSDGSPSGSDSPSAPPKRAREPAACAQFGSKDRPRLESAPVRRLPAAHSAAPATPAIRAAPPYPRWAHIECGHLGDGRRPRRSGRIGFGRLGHCRRLRPAPSGFCVRRCSCVA